MSSSIDAQQQGSFQEILSPEERDTEKPSYLDAYIAHVQPSECGPLVKKIGKKVTTQSSSLSILTEPTADLGHLRRVRRRQNNALHVKTATSATATSNSSEKSSDNIQKQKKQQKQQQPNENVELHVLLGSVVDVDKFCQAHQIPDAFDYFRQEYGIHNSSNNIIIESVPARMAESDQELQEFNANWPTLYFPNKTAEHKRREKCLMPLELQQMTTGMQAALNDALGAIMLDPKTGNVASCAQDECDKQNEAEFSNGSRDRGGIPPTLPPTVTKNPLATPILYAIQGVSRREREMACSVGMDNPAFQKGQYLCTGFDCYTIREPSVFEAMALVHSRIRRVIFGVAAANNTKELQEGGISQYNVHCLPNTNHNFRAFVCHPDSELGKQCIERIKNRKD